MVNMKPKKIKARKMWAFAHLACYAQRLAAICYSPVYVLPADAASVEAMVEQMALAAYNCGIPGIVKKLPSDLVGVAASIAYRKEARAALAAIGIKSTT